MAPLFCCLLLLGCASSSVTPAPAESGTAADKPLPAPTNASPVRDADTLRTIAAAPLIPDQGVEERHIGKRIRGGKADLAGGPQPLVEIGTLELAALDDGCVGRGRVHQFVPQESLARYFPGVTLA